MTGGWVWFLRNVVAGVLFALACLPAGVMVVWWLVVGRMASQAVTDLGAVALLLGVAGWVVLPRGRPPARAVSPPAGPGAVDEARAEAWGELERIQASWQLPAYVRPRPGEWLGEVGDRDW